MIEWGARDGETLQGLGGTDDRLLPSDAKHSVAVGLEERLALGVVLAGELVVVPCGAVGLDHEPLVGPAEVGDDTPTGDHERHVDVGAGEPAAEDEIKHHVLELRAGRRRAGGEDPPEVADAASGSESLDRLGELREAD
jgi:hypothetical protein